MKISVAIMAHPKRGKQAGVLYSKLKRMPFNKCTLVFDKVNDEWTNGKNSLQQYHPNGDYHVVIQDDAILTPNFYENLENAIKALDQKTLISLYTGTARPLANRVKAAVDKAADGDMLRHHQLFWGVGIAIPVSHIEPMLEFVEKIDLQYDNKIGEFYCQNGLPVYYLIPSLVDHDDDIDSLIAGHGRDIDHERRVAHRLATGLVNWTEKRHFI